MFLRFSGLLSLNAVRIKCTLDPGKRFRGWRWAVSEHDAKYSDLVEIAKRIGEFRKWGKLIGAFLYLRSLNAARPRSFLGSELIALGTVAGGLVLKYGVPAFFG